MRKSKDLNACISLLKDLQHGGSVDLEQRKSVERVVDELKQIRREPNLGRAEQQRNNTENRGRVG